MNPRFLRWSGVVVLSISAVCAVVAVSQDEQKPEQPVNPPDVTAPAKDAAPSELPPEIHSRIDEFFSVLGSAKIPEAYKVLLAHSKIAERPADVAMLEEHARKAISEYGAIGSFDLIDVRWAGKALVRVTAVSVGADYPLRWRFYFYNPNEKWRLLDLRVDDALAGMFDADFESELIQTGEGSALPSGNQESSNE